MTLYLHIGTEKTGSSFLQTLAARNRNGLVKNKIFFPRGGKRDKDMLVGKVSPGNARLLFEALRSKKSGDVSSILSRARLEAQHASCSSVLFSNENLVELAEITGAFSMLEEAALKSGFDRLNMLLILRDPVDQALSLFKHRAKYGTIDRMDQWLQREFHTLRVLDAFVVNKTSDIATVSYRKYTNDAKHMFDVFFNQWLHADAQVKYQEVLVNPSLTLSELLFLRGVNRVNPALVVPCYEALLKLDRSKKAKDTNLETRYRAVINQHLLKYSPLLTQLNSMLPPGESLVIPEPIDHTLPLSGDEVISLSGDQLNAILQEQHRRLSPIGRLQTAAMHTVRQLAHILRR